MPPEVFQWDRRGYRRYDRPGSDPAIGGGFSGGGGGPTRWRDQHHPQPLPPPYHRHHHGWYSGFRSRPLPFPPPPGLGKQGGRNMCQEESGQVFPPFGSQFIDRISDDMNCRPPSSRIDGRYFRNNREIRGSFSHKVLKDHSWEPASWPCGPGRPISDVNEQSSVENVKSYNNGSNNRNRSNKSSFHPQPESVNLLGQSQSLSKEKHDKNGANTERACKGQKLEKENSLESIDCKSLKRTRLGSLSSRGSGFSLSSTFKSMGTDSNDMVAQVQPKIAMPDQSPSGDAAACPISATTASSEDTSSRKKLRLQWGEGLKKYEKKKVEGPEDGATRNGLVISDSDTEVVQSHAVNLADESPKAAALLDSASTATPSSVACSSSPGVKEKQSIKAASFDHDKTNFSYSPSSLSYSPSSLSQMQCEGPTFSLENLELMSIANLSSSISELLRPDYPHSVDSGFVRTTAMNKLLLWKVDVLKALQMTESNIDSLDTEMKTSISEVGSSFPYPAASCLLPVDKILENITEELDDENTVVKDEDIDNSESAISKFVEMPSAEDFCCFDPANHIEGFLNSDVNNSKNLEVNCLENSLNDEETKVRVDDSELILSSNYPTLASFSNSCCGSEDLYDLILATNKDSADRASAVLTKLLPANQCHFDISTAAGVSYLPSDSMIMKKKFLTRKRFVQFNEKVTTLKFKVFHHFWKENHLLSVRRVRLKSHKKDRSWTDYFGYRKHRSCPSRFSSPVFANGNLSLVPTEEVIDFVSRLLSNFKLRLYRNTLKMPVLILDPKEKFMSRFISSNGLVEDPRAVEKERSMINIWTSEEREIFIDKLATFGKDFRKIAYFLDHKATADCIEFYYKNHKSEYFEKSKKMGFPKQRKTLSSSTYLVASGKRWNREANAASLDILGSASAVVASAESGIEIQQKCTSRFFLGSSAYGESRGDIGSLQRLNNLDIKVNDRETLAVDVLAGICSSLSHDAMNSCITSSVDPAEIYEELYDSSLDEGCEEMDTTDWTDEEKSFFIQAVSSYGKDFEMISQCLRTRSINECKVFFSKTHKCLGLDMIQPRPSNAVSGDVTGGGSDDTEDACVVESETIICCERSGCEMGEDLLSPDLNMSCESDTVGIPTLKLHLNECEENNGTGFDDFMDAENSGPDLCQEKDEAGLDFDTDANGQCANCGTLDVSCDTESLRVIEEAENHVQSNKLGETQNAASIEISDGHRRPGVSSHPCGDAHSSTQLDMTLGCQKKVNHNASSAARGNAISDVQCQKIAWTGNRQQHLSCCSFSDRVESSQILGDLKVSMSIVKERNVGISCEKEVSLQSDTKVDGNFPLDRSSGFSLQKCNSLRYQNSSEAPVMSQEQTRDYFRKGGVKLFGQILISSQDKQNSCIPPNDKKMPHPKSGKQSFSGNHTINLNSTQAKFDCDDYPSSENIPLTNFRSWDTKKFQNAFPPFPDSTLLLHQNPAAVIMPSDKLKQPLLHPVVKSFPIPELSSCNRVADYEVPRKGEVQPFTVDLEMQRTKSCSNVMSGTQQPKKGMVGIIVVGSQCAGVSDPVEAIKMHYAKS